jgi:hypothetical protein
LVMDKQGQSVDFDTKSMTGTYLHWINEFGEVVAGVVHLL